MVRGGQAVTSGSCSESHGNLGLGHWKRSRAWLRGVPMRAGNGEREAPSCFLHRVLRLFPGDKADLHGIRSFRAISGSEHLQESRESEEATRWGSQR